MQFIINKTVLIMLQPPLFTNSHIFLNSGRHDRDSRNFPCCYSRNNTWSRMLHLREWCELKHSAVKSCYVFVFLFGVGSGGGACPSSDDRNKDKESAF